MACGNHKQRTWHHKPGKWTRSIQDHWSTCGRGCQCSHCRCHVCCQLCTSRGMQCRSVQTVVCRHPVWTLRVQKCQQVRHPTCSDQSLNRGTEFEHKRILGHITTVFAHNNTVLHKIDKSAHNHIHLRKTTEFQQTVQLPTHFLKGSYSTEECYIWGSESIPLMDCTHQRLCRHSLRWWTCGRGRWSCR